MEALAEYNNPDYQSLFSNFVATSGACLSEILLEVTQFF